MKLRIRDIVLWVVIAVLIGFLFHLFQERAMEAASKSTQNAETSPLAVVFASSRA